MVGDLSVASRGTHALHGTTSFPPGSAAGEWIIFRGGGRPAAASYRVSPLRCAAGQGGHCRAQAGNCRSPGRIACGPATFPIQDPLNSDPPCQDHPHLGPSISLAILTQDHPPPDPPPPLPTPPELLLRVSTAKMCQTVAIRGAPKTPLDSRTCKNRLADPREEGYQT